MLFCDGWCWVVYWVEGGCVYWVVVMLGIEGDGVVVVFVGLCEGD